MSRQCPDCQIPMNQMQFRGIVLDDCPQCGGIWFDDGELCKLIKSDDNLAMASLECKCAKSPVVDIRERAQKLCPNCDERLTPYKYAYSSDVVLDECDKCFGVWIQDGELQQIDSYLHEHAQDLPPGFHAAVHSVSTDLAQQMKTRPNRAKQVVSYWSLVGQRRTAQPL